jgi:predicted N-acyltransferase
MIDIRVFDTIADVPTQWDELSTDQSLMQSRRFWQLVEDVGLNDVRCRYLAVYDENQLIAATTSYTITTDIAIFAPPKLRSLLKQIRRWWPGFLKLTMLECGTPITINPPLILLAGQNPEPVISSIHNELTSMARSKGAWVIVARDFEATEERQLRVWNHLGYHLVDNLPNTYLNICWSSAAEYQAAMRSYYRSKLRRMLKKNALRHTHHELVDDFEDISEALCRQWRAVSLNASEYDREELTPEFYRQFSVRFGKASKVLLFYRGEEWVAHALLLIDGSCLRWLYFGRENPDNDDLYIYAAYTVVETAITLGLKSVEGGLTTYGIKKDLGLQMVHTRMAIRSPWKLLNPLTGFVYRVLNRPASMHNYSVFKGSTLQQQSNSN